MKRSWLACVITTFLAGVAPVALALDAFEIQVYEAEVNKPGQAGLEIHLNHVAEGQKEQAYPEEIPSHGLTHLTFEPSYGLTSTWELGGYLQFARTSDGRTYYGGFKLRSKWVVPKEKTAPYFLGLNVEVGRIPMRFEEDGWATEFRPILGVELGQWLFDLNPIFGWSLSGKDGIAPHLEPALKIRYDTKLGFGVGTEYYAGFGPLDKIPGLKDQEHVLFLAGDLIDGPIELNVGVGYGLTQASNRWTAKTIVGFTF